VLALGKARNQAVPRGLVTKRPIYGRNVPNPLHAGQHAGAKRTYDFGAIVTGPEASWAQTFRAGLSGSLEVVDFVVTL
jgi:hypothetical protein